MPALNFRKEYAKAVENGTKCQTVRAPRNDGRDIKVGDTIYLYVGMRTKNCRRLGVAKCTRRRWLDLPDRTRAYLDGEPLSGPAATAFARRDGFPSFPRFVDVIEGMHNLPFSGFVYNWILE